MFFISPIDFPITPFFKCRIKCNVPLNSHCHTYGWRTIRGIALRNPHLRTPVWTFWNPIYNFLQCIQQFLIYEKFYVYFPWIYQLTLNFHKTRMVSIILLNFRFVHHSSIFLFNLPSRDLHRKKDARDWKPHHNSMLCLN